MIKANQLIIVLLSLIGFSSYNCFSQDDFVQINYIQSFDNLSANDNMFNSLSGVETSYSLPLLRNFFLRADAAVMFYSEGNYFNSSLIDESFTALTFNTNANYIINHKTNSCRPCRSFYKLDPFIFVGIGYTNYSQNFGGFTFNYGLGFQFWFNELKKSNVFNKIGLNSRAEFRSFFKNIAQGNYVIVSIGISFSLY